MPFEANQSSADQIPDKIKLDRVHFRGESQREQEACRRLSPLLPFSPSRNATERADLDQVHIKLATSIPFGESCFVVQPQHKNLHQILHAFKNAWVSLNSEQAVEDFRSRPLMGPLKIKMKMKDEENVGL